MSTNLVLVTGGSGFVAAHLMPALHAMGYAITATGPTDRPTWLTPSIDWHKCDLRDPSGIAGLRRDWWAVVHLAARSIPSGFGSIEPVVDNVSMTVNLLEHVRDCRFLCVSSCHVYRPSMEPLDEEAPTHPRGRYGLSKLLTEQAAMAFSDRLSVRIARPFNHLGRDMPMELLAPSLLALAREQTTAPLELQGLDSTRDFIDVRDVVEAYAAIMRLEPGPDVPVFNVCTGRPVRIGELAQAALRMVGSRRSVEIRDVPRSGDDVPHLVGRPARLMAATGWRPTHSLEDSLGWMLHG